MNILVILPLLKLFTHINIFCHEYIYYSVGLGKSDDFTYNQTVFFLSIYILIYLISTLIPIISLKIYLSEFFNWLFNQLMREYFDVSK